MRYEIDYRDARGRLHRRVMVAEDVSEVRKVIRTERLRVVEVRPPIDGPPAKPAQAKPEAKPLEVEVISRPSDLSGDRTGGKLPWMEIDEEADRRREALAARRNARKFKWNVNRRKHSHELLADALIEGALDIGRDYTAEQIEELTGIRISGGMEMMSMRMAESTDFRLVEDHVNKDQRGKRKYSRWRFENKVERRQAA